MGAREDAFSEATVKAMIEALKRGDSVKPKFACNPNPLGGIGL